MLSGDDLAILLFFLSLVFGFGLEAMKAETAARRVAFGIIATACLLTGVFWLQIKQIWPPFTEATISVGTNPLAWFVVSMFILGVFAFHRPRNRASEGRGNETEKHMEPSAESRTAPVPAPQPQKIFIDVSPAYLMDLYKNRTSIQGDALAAAYMGKWIAVMGKVRDIYSVSDALYAQIYDKDDSFVSAGFSKETSEKVAHITHGTTVTVRGKITAIDTMRVKLQDCDLTEAS
jgi:hypothetical protein